MSNGITESGSPIPSDGRIRVPGSRTRLPSGGGALLTATALALAIKVFALDLAVVEGRSMEPFVSRGSLVLVLKCAYGLRAPGREGSYWLRWGSPAPGDTVLAYPPSTGTRVVKRVASEASPYGTYPEGPRGRPIYLLGDNPPASRDSREYGPVGMDDIAGKVIRLRP